MGQKIKELKAIKDEWGGIDRKILKLVAALNLAGIKTYISCAGHANHGSPFPYVTFRGSSAKAKKLLTEFYKTHKPAKGVRIGIYKGKASYWMYSGGGFVAWKNAVDKKAGKKLAGEIISKKERLALAKTLPSGQKEMADFAEFLKKKGS